MRIEKLRITRALCVSVAAAAAVEVNDGKATNGQQVTCEGTSSSSSSLGNHRIEQSLAGTTNHGRASTGAPLKEEEEANRFKVE